MIYISFHDIVRERLLMMISLMTFPVWEKVPPETAEAFTLTLFKTALTVLAVPVAGHKAGDMGLACQSLHHCRKEAPVEAYPVFAEMAVV